MTLLEGLHNLRIMNRQSGVGVEDSQLMVEGAHDSWIINPGGGGGGIFEGAHEPAATDHCYNTNITLRV